MNWPPRTGTRADSGGRVDQASVGRTSTRPARRPVAAAYDVLDPLLELYVEDDATAETMIASGHDPQLVLQITRLVDRSEYNAARWPGRTDFQKGFGRDRRMPSRTRSPRELVTPTNREIAEHLLACYDTIILSSARVAGVVQ